MRKIALIAGAVVALSGVFCNADAQSHYKSNVSLGVKAGADMSRVFFTPSTPQKFHVGSVAGVTFRYVEESHFGLQAELNFVQRGWNEDFEQAPYYYRRTINYIELPVLAHIYFGRRGRFFVNLGPQVALCLGSSESANFDPAHTQDLPDFPNTNRNNSQMTLPVTQKVDFGISAGLGGEFNLSPKNIISLEARFYYGIGNITKSGRQEAVRGSNQMTLSFTAGYWFRIK